jgi:pimeloyl-ACP methyl ester carboxylesterase
VKLQLGIWLLAGILLSGCGKFNLTPEVSIFFQNPTNVSETGFNISWSVNPSDYASLTFTLSSDPSFNNIIRDLTFHDNSTNSARIDSLRGATTYYFRISLVREPGSIFISPTESIEMPFHNELVSFQTPDSALLKGYVSYLGSVEGARPAVILMHELKVFLNGWINSEILKSLVADGYICLTYYNRGHGSSSYFEDLSELMSDPVFLANDLRGAIGFLSTAPFADAGSLALVGASMGATMAIRGSGSDSVRTTVALSPADDQIDYLYPGIPLRSILYFAGERDRTDMGSGAVNFPVEARALYDRTLDPRKLIIVGNSDAHGTGLLKSPGVQDEILGWIRLHLPV